ncbi:MAG: hypothetical protein ALECFALPRED_004559 [Alectoria fallacina]|uniref:Centromere protein S n=1 Tax=Alectoria fallacina TaxID=1903189 RepID=A0A8H3FUG4_9LECA|nr:MAG: hypothetical protein ALECFALPRED_004559 [Alectoria fallacina]
MADSEEQALEERLKSALWFSIGKIVDEETLKLGVNATPQFIGALTEMVWAQIENVSTDLKNFARHAGRSTISTDDVMLLSRRNEGLEALLRSYMNTQKPGKPSRKKR